MKKWNQWQSIENEPRQGGQAKIHKVIDTSKKLKGTYALKEVKRIDRKNDRFIKEINAISIIKEHPNVIRLVDKAIFQDSNRNYYVMDYVEGNLNKYIKAKKQIEYKNIFNLFFKICEGVKHIHTHEIIHRDLKPANILINKSIPLIADFGICLVRNDVRGTGENEAVGSRYYMAPELEDGKNLDVSYNADIYSIAKILYFMLSGGKVFAREKYNLPEWSLEKIFKDKRFNYFDQLLKKSLEVKPLQRLQNVDQFIEMFKECVDNFNDHPKSKILDVLNTYPNCDVSDLKNLEMNHNKIRFLLEEYDEGVINIDKDLLIKFSKFIDKKSIYNFYNAYEKVAINLNADEKLIIAENLYSTVLLNDGLGIIRFDNPNKLEIEFYASISDKDIVLNSLAKRSAFCLRHNHRALRNLLSNLNRISEENIETVLFEAIFCNFDEKYEVFKSLLDSYPDQKKHIIGGMLTGATETQLDEVYSIINSNVPPEIIVFAFGYALNNNHELIKKLKVENINQPHIKSLLNLNILE